MHYVLLTVLPRNLHIHICKSRVSSLLDQPCNLAANIPPLMSLIDEVSLYSSNIPPTLSPGLIKSVLKRSSVFDRTTRDRTWFFHHDEIPGSSVDSRVECIERKCFPSHRFNLEHIGLAGNRRCDSIRASFRMFRNILFGEILKLVLILFRVAEFHLANLLTYIHTIDRSNSLRIIIDPIVRRERLESKLIRVASNEHGWSTMSSRSTIFYFSYGSIRYKKFTIR